ncbi:MAG: sulfatase/phosphatase domain-containing protein [Planctomycetota bacterium]
MTRSTPCLVILAAVLMIACSTELFAAQPPSRPNMIFIFTDDHASHAISAYGSKINKTPNIDRIAREGMIFRNSFCTNSICGPSRAVILTGKHSHLNGFMSNYDTFDGSQQTFPKLLRKAGYQTAMVGKWHLKTDPTGFDYWEVLQGQGPYYNPPMKTAGRVVAHTGYTTDIITDLALTWLERDRDPSKPFLLMYQHKAPHRSWEPGPKHLHLYDDVTIPEPATLFDDYKGRTTATQTQTMTIAEHMNERDLKLIPPSNLTKDQLRIWNAAYQPKNRAFRAAGLTGEDLVRWKYQRYIKDYLRCIKAVDENIGRVLDYLDERGLAENTIVFYSSDQGFYLGDHGWYDKRWMYEESLKMPLVVRWPGVIRPGSSSQHLVQNLDYAETFLEIAGAPIPGDMQGRSLVPILKGESPSDWRQSIYYHYYEYPGAHMVRKHRGVRTDRYKLIKYYNISEWELFDLKNDPDEVRSVYTNPKYKQIRADLEKELLRLETHYADKDPEAPRGRRIQNALKKKAAQVELEQVVALDRPDGKERRDLDPSARPITVGAVCTPGTLDGVIVAHGGASLGYSLYLRKGHATFAVRSGGEMREIRTKLKLEAGTTYALVGVLRASGRLQIWVNGKVEAKGAGLIIERKPSDSLSVGKDSGSIVGSHTGTLPFDGALRDIRVYWGGLDRQAIATWGAKPKN